MLAIAMNGAMAQPMDPKASRFYEDALTRYEAKDYPGAIIQLKNALQLAPKSLPVQLLLGKALLSTSDVRAAEVALTEALSLGVARAEVVVPLSQALLEQGRAKEVVDDLRFALAGLPASVAYDLRMQRAVALADLGDGRAALREIEAARQASPDRVDSWMTEVSLRIRGGELDAALGAARRAIAMAPDSAQAYYLLGSVHHVRGALKEARKAYDDALERVPKHVDALLARAGIALDSGRLADAAIDVALLREASPHDPRAAYLHAQLALRQGDAVAARAALNEVTSLLDPVPEGFLRYKPQLLMLGGLAHHGLGETEKARPYLEGVVRAQGQVAAAKLLAQIHLSEGSIDSAVKVLENYLQAVPQDLQAMELLAQSHANGGRVGRAVQILRAGAERSGEPAVRASLGLMLIRAGDRQQAEAELAAAVKAEPALIEASAALAQLRAASGQLKSALALAESLVRRVPSDARLKGLLGSLRARAGDRVGARKVLGEALTLQPGLSSARLELAELDLREGQVDAARGGVATLLQAQPGHVDAMLLMARIAERQGAVPDTLQWYAKAIDAAKGDVRPSLLLVGYHLRRGEAALAVKATAALNVSGSDNPAVLLAAARAYIASGDAPSARVTLGRASRIVGYAPEENLEIALLQLSNGQPADAAYSLDKVLRDAPNDLRANALLVDVLLRQGDAERALDVARGIATREPGRSIGHLLVGNALRVKGDVGGAVAAYRRAHANSPATETLIKLHSALRVGDPRAADALLTGWLRSHSRDVDAWRARADSLAAAGQWPAARDAYQSLLAVAPRDAAALNNLANVLLRLQDPQALAAAERAAAAAPGSVLAMDTLGWALFRAGQKDKALQTLRDARLRAPGNPEVRYHLAAVLADAGRGAEARRELDEALALRVPFESVAEARALRRALD
ncbi:MAG: PEP-CTERM system TPR-repeat protein PrsT [Rhodoferax sp.]|nr:PEP-CTERM system TPR-repeat protein PrsT [Rhodoferax sp.]